MPLFWRRARRPSRHVSSPRSRPALELLEARLAPAVFTVTNGNDSGPGSLRQALLDSNAAPGADSVRFAIPGAGVHTIAPLSPLPAVTDTLTVDGSSQPGWAGTPLIELNGASAGPGATGVWLAGPSSTLLSLAVNRFAGYGVVLQSYSDLVQGCFIGTNAAGTAALANGYDGVVVLGPGSQVVGNVVSGNGRFGINLSAADNTVVESNYVGTTASGTAPLANAGGGLALLTGAGANVIAYNVVSGNGAFGVLLTGAGTLGNGVYANRVGTDVTGAAALPNAGPGVLVVGGTAYNAIGAPTPGQRNVISGNAQDGVVLAGAGTAANVVAGNYVGTNAAGTAALANGGDGILVETGASGNGVYSNIASGNKGAGVGLSGPGTTGNRLAGDLLGTNAAGTAAVPNKIGLQIDAGAAGNVVGGGNVLSGNALFGVLLTGSGTTGNAISSNLIGTTATGAGALGNGSHGAFVTGQAAQNTLASNLIANNGGNGVLVGSDPALGAGYGVAAGAGNSVLGDLLFANAKLAIDLGPDDGVTANDSQGHSGPNGWQNFPVLTAATAVSGGTRVQGSLHSAPSSSFRLDFYASPAADPSGHGQAQVFLGFLSVTTDGTGAASFDAVLSVPTTVGWVVSATATSPSGSTSELGSDVVVPQGPPVANAGAKQSGKEGSAVTFSGSVTGGQPALSYSWSFGDGGTASGTLTPSHVYDDNGTYTVTLTVTDSLGRSSQSSTTATVANVAPTPNPGGPYSGTAGVAVAFSGSATDPSNADTKAGFSWLWSFGDGATSTAQNPSHVYAQAGTYTVTLTATDKDGGSASASASVAVQSGSFNGDPYIVTPYLKIPNFGAKPNIVSVKSGNWSDPSVWSLGRLPAAGDIVDVNPGTTVTYDVNSTAALTTLEVQSTGSLKFRTDITTQLDVQNLVVLQGGYLEIGTPAAPVAAGVKAEIVFLNQPLNTATDPEQYGNGLVALGKVVSAGAAKAPFVTLAQEAHAGDTVLHLASAATGWQAGDKLQLPDTRQLDYGGDNGTYTPQWETATLQAISADGLTLTLAAPLQYSHLGARDAQGTLSFLPQVANTTRNVSIHSQSATGTRGYALFTHRADVSVSYTAFGGMGRTTGTPFDDTTFNSSGQVTHVGTNEENRNPITFLDLFGPANPQPNGYQYTFIGNTVTCPLDPMPFIWGVTVANSHYGLIQANDLINWNGAGVMVDGVSSYNRLDGNFVMRVTGTSNRTDQALQGDAFWFGNPNNYVTNNIATDINGGGWTVYSYGYSIDMTGGTTGSDQGGNTAVGVPAFQGADPSVAGQSKTLNMNDVPILQFAGNSVYGATSSGMTVWWLGTFNDTFYADAQRSVVKSFVAWNIGTRSFYGYPTNNLTIDGMVVRGDPSFASNGFNYTQGINFDDYMTRNLVIQNADIQGVYTGIEAPFMVGRVPTMDTTVIQNSFLSDTVDIELTPPRSVNGSSGLSPQTLNITNVTFAHPSAVPQSWREDLSLAYVSSDSLGTSNMSVPQYIYVTSYNGTAGDNFQAFYDWNAPTNAKPRQYVLGKVVPD